MTFVFTRVTQRDVIAAVNCIGKPKRVANNTYEYQRPDGATVIRLHQTDIIVKRPDGKIELNSGGWRTPTTKDRFNHHSPYRVYSDKGTWVIHDGERRVPYMDGIVLPDAFEKPFKANQQAERECKLKGEIKKFVTKTIVTGKPIPMPNNGDCWDCLMFDREEPRGPNTLMSWHGPVLVGRDQGRKTDHLLQHIREKYMHGSLIVNAFRGMGFQDIGIQLICYSERPDYTRIRRVVSTYLKRRLGLTTK